MVGQLESQARTGLAHKPPGQADPSRTEGSGAEGRSPSCWRPHLRGTGYMVSGEDRRKILKAAAASWRERGA